MARKIKICTEDGCRNEQTVMSYCRLHYLKNWKKIRAEVKRQKVKKLDRYADSVLKKKKRGKEEEKDQFDGSPTQQSSDYDYSSSEEVERLLEDLGYADPESLDKIVSNLRILK